MTAASQDFGTRVRSGALWSYASQLLLTVISFVAGVIMARLLGPADFGVFIAVTAFTSIMLLLVQFGIPPALIQARELDPAQADVGFWLMLLLAGVFFSLLFVIAPALARVYVEANFTPVMYAMGLVFFLTVYPAFGFALLRRDMRFAEVARVNAWAHLLSTVVSVTAAFAGLGVYSLVLGVMVALLASAVGIARLLSWRPAWPRPVAMGRLLRYAALTTLNNVQDMAINRADNMIVGAVLGAASLGLYNRAFSLARLPSDQFAESLGPVLLGALSRVQTDPAWSRLLYLKAVSAISVVTLPFLAFLLITGPDLVRLIYGDAWAGAGVPIQVMVVGGYFVMLAALLQRLAYAQNLVFGAARIHFVVLVVTVVLVVAVAPFGLIVIAAAITLRELLWTLMLARLLERSALGLPVCASLYASAPAVIAAAVAAVVALAGLPTDAAAAPWGALVELAKLGFVLFFSYALTLLLIILAWRRHAPLAHTAGMVGAMVRRIVQRRSRGGGDQHFRRCNRSDPHPELCVPER